MNPAQVHDTRLIASTAQLPTEVHSLQVQLSLQRLKVIFHSGKILWHRVSTSIRPACNLHNSMGTPTGWHRIYKKTGDGQPPGTVLDTCDQLYATGNTRITSRILWLDGLEPGINKGGNCDTRTRCIYIHGTPEEDLIGTPVTDGCIRMADRDVIELYDRVDIDTRVLITD